ncbi:hypothetical protein BCR33DRAFT_723629, partial [Rhizoclosmatium globosum]
MLHRQNATSPTKQFRPSFAPQVSSPLSQLQIGGPSSAVTGGPSSAAIDRNTALMTPTKSSTIAIAELPFPWMVFSKTGFETPVRGQQLGRLYIAYDDKLFDFATAKKDSIPNVYVRPLSMYTYQDVFEMMVLF